MSRNQILARARAASNGDTVQVVGYSAHELEQRQAYREAIEALRGTNWRKAYHARMRAMRDAIAAQAKPVEIVTSAPELSSLPEAPFPLCRPVLRSKVARSPESGVRPVGGTAIGNFFQTVAIYLYS